MPASRDRMSAIVASGARSISCRVMMVVEAPVMPPPLSGTLALPIEFAGAVPDDVPRNAGAALPPLPGEPIPVRRVSVTLICGSGTSCASAPSEKIASAAAKVAAPVRLDFLVGLLDDAFSGRR